MYIIYILPLVEGSTLQTVTVTSGDTRTQGAEAVQSRVNPADRAWRP